MSLSPATPELIDQAADIPVFVRTVEIPPGAPWDQYRAVRFQARHGAPLSIEMLHTSIRRLAPWRSDRPGRFAIAYVKRDAVYRRLIFVRQIDGAAVKFTFENSAATQLRARSVGGRLALAVVSLGLIATTGWLTAGARDANEAQIASAEQVASHDLAISRAARKRMRELATITRLGLQHGAMRDVLDDLAWAAAHKAAGTSVTALQWENGEMDIGVTGKSAPFDKADRVISPLALSDNGSTWHVGASSGGRTPLGFRAPTIISKRVTFRRQSWSQ